MLEKYSVSCDLSSAMMMQGRSLSRCCIRFKISIGWISAIFSRHKINSQFWADNSFSIAAGLSSLVALTACPALRSTLTIASASVKELSIISTRKMPSALATVVTLLFFLFVQKHRFLTFQLGLLYFHPLEQLLI